MKPLTYQAVRSDPELLNQLIRDAHRERSEAIARLLRGLFLRQRRHAPATSLRTSACG